jgi:hypothetical protein
MQWAFQSQCALIINKPFLGVEGLARVTKKGKIRVTGLFENALKWD